MKIHIIGGSGSGKSTLAQKISDIKDIKHYDLDDVMWDNSGTYGSKREKEARDKMLLDYVSKDSWIIEGVYYKWVAPSFENADQIVFLDIPYRVTKKRIIKRFIRRKLGLAKGKKETLKSVKALLKWAKNYANASTKEILELIKPYSDKVVILHNEKEIDKYLANIA